MGLGLSEIRVQMRRVVMFSIKGCYKTVLNHPFLVSMLCFIAFLYRSFPFLFSLLVAASPVLVCTAVLLGTLLSFGESNVPEIEREEKTTHDIVPLKTELLCDATHVEREDSSYFVERYIEEEKDIVDQAIDKISEVHRGQSFSELAPLLEKRSRELNFGDGVLEEATREFGEQNNEEKHDNGELMESQYSPIPGDDNESIESGYDRLDSFDSKMVNLNSLPGSPWKKEEVEEDEKDEKEEDSEASFDSKRVNLNALPCSPWKREDSEEEEEVEEDKKDEEKEEAEDSEASFDSKRVNLNAPPGSPWKREESEEEKEEDEDEDESFDSGSDQAESSSPDASMTDIIPMLDELHPLLDEDTPKHVRLSHDGSDAASDSSGKSSESDNESDDGCENQEELEVADDENEDEMRDKEDKSKSAITWTEEDQKNLIDLGSSELERNQRLESLIARRRALEKMRVMMTEKNLIDLESNDLPFSILPISTARNNPFDVSNDNYDLGLPPIPGSAPSIMLQRRNPFDLPYDSSEEKPDLMEDSFQEEFMTSQAKDPLFRRHESFIVRPSVFGLNRQDKQDIHLRPYFVPERMASEGTSYSPFQRQSSELSDSKVSSVRETESLGSVEDMEDDKHLQDARDKSLDGEELESKDLIDDNICEETELTSKIGQNSEHVRHGRQSSEQVESLEQLGIVETHHEVEETFLQDGRVANSLELNPTETQPKLETSDQRYISQTSSSSLSEVSERIYADKEGDMWSSLEETRGHVEQNRISRQASLDGSDFHITSTSVEQTSHGEPVYDSSPSATGENIFSSSFSSDLHVESETGFAPILVERTVSFTERESVEHSQDIEKSIPTNEDISAMVNEEILLSEVVCNNELDVAKAEISQDDEVFGSASARPVHELVVGPASIVSKSEADEDIGYKEENIEHAQQQISSSRFDADTHIVSQHATEQIVESLSTFSQHQNIHQLDDEQHSVIAKEVLLVQPAMPSFERQSVEDVTEEEDAILTELHDPSNAVENLVTDAHIEVDEKLISVGHHSEVCEEELEYSDKSIDEQPSEVRKEAPVILVESIEEASIEETLNASEIPDLDNGIPIINSPRTPDSISNLHGVDEVPTDAGISGLRNSILGEVENDNQIKVLENYILPPEATDFHHDEQYIVEDEDGIEDIDEVLLSELDTVGDFSIKELRSSQNELEGRINSSGEEFAEGEVHSAVDPRSGGGRLLTDSDIGPSDPRVKLNLDVQEMVPEIPIVEAQNSVFDGAELKSAQAGVTEMPQEVIVKEDTDAGMPLLEAQTIQDFESAFWQVYEKELEKSSILEQSNAELVTAESGMLVLEAQAVEDIGLAFRQIGEKEIENSNVLEQPNAALVTEESGTCDNAEVFEMTSSVQEDSFLQICEKEIENSKMLELPNVELVTEESGNTDNATILEVTSSVQGDSVMPVLEAQTVEDTELAFRQICEKEIDDSNVLELHNTELVTEESASCDYVAVLEVTSSVQEDSVMPVLEAQTVEDTELAFRKICDKELNDSNVLELNNAEVITEGSGSSDNAAVLQVTSSVQEDFVMPVVEAQTVENIELAFRQICDKEMDDSNVLELHNVEVVTEESGSSDNAAVLEVTGSVQEDYGMPQLEAQTVEDIQLAFRKVSEEEIKTSNVLELPNSKLVTDGSGSSSNAAVLEGTISVQEDSRMLALEAQTVEDIELAFKKISEQEIENSTVLELPNTELVNEEYVGSDNTAVLKVSSLTHNEIQLPTLETRSTELPNTELLNEEPVSSGNAAALEVSNLAHHEMQLPNLERTSTVFFDWDHEDISESNTETILHDSVDVGMHMRESRDIGASSDSGNFKINLALEQVLDENLEKPLNLSSEGESAEAKPSGAGSSKDMELSVTEFDVSEISEGDTKKGDVIKEAKALTAEKTGHAVDIPTTADVEGKKDKPEKLGSSSSSSSSSSDSERE